MRAEGGERRNNSPRANKILNRKKKSRNIYQKQKREGEEKGKEGGRGGGGGGRGGEYVETSAAARHRRRAHHRSPQRAVTLHPLTLPLRASSLLELLSKTKESKSEGRRLTTEYWRSRNVLENVLERKSTEKEQQAHWATSQSNIILII